MTNGGCKKCAANTYSTDGASTCTPCPSGQISPVGSTSADSCEDESMDSM